MTYYSQIKQDYFIDLILDQKQEGFFIDIGAHDGITLSNSYFFEKERNWNGICFEPMPEVFNKLKENRTCITINAAIYTNDTSDLTFTRCYGYTEMLSGISEFRDEKHIQRTESEILKYKGKTEEIKVKGVELNTILDQYSITKIASKMFYCYH